MKKIEKLYNQYLPTPLQKLDNITKLMNKGNIYIKRDDMTGVGLGGNKIRKLDYIIKAALDEGYDAVMTLGGVQTNHGRLTAAMAAKYGMKCILLCYGLPPKELSGNLLLSRILGADIRFLDTQNIKNNFSKMTTEEIVHAYKSFRGNTEDEIISEYAKKGMKVLPVPIGGHSNIGTLGYVDCVKELMEQSKGQGINLDYVVCGNGSGGTYAGLLLGIKYYNAPFKLIGINISKKTPEEVEELIEHMNDVSKEFEMGVEITKADIELYSDTVGLGYNIPDENTRKTIYQLARNEGIFVDPCYTGKSFTGYLKLIEENIISPNESSVFIHTGGGPGIWTKEHLDEFTKELWNDVAIYEAKGE